MPGRISGFLCSDDSQPTRIAVPVKVLLGIAMALFLQPYFLLDRTMREGYVIIRYVIEKVDLVLRQHECGGDGVDGSITPAFVKETAVPVEQVEVVCVCF